MSRIAPGLEAVAGQRSQQIVYLVTGIDDDGLAGVLAAQHESVLQKRRNGACFDDHEPVCRPFSHSGMTWTTTPYREATRVHTSVLAAAEKRLLIWMAERLPAWVNSDHLTALAGLASAGAGLCYWIGPEHAWAMFGAIVMLAINWFGDSLDGTLARVRHHERPRYGFYVDHVLDVIGILCPRRQVSRWAVSCLP